jgi:hypothetical protein
MFKTKQLLTVTSSESYILDGVDVFAEEELTGRMCVVRDPLYRRLHREEISIIRGKTREHKIVICEFTNGVYGIYELKDWIG